jgi:MFS family permease
MSSFTPGRVSDRLLLSACYTGGAVCYGLLLLLEPSYAVSMGLMFLAGAFIAAQAPAMGSLAVAKFGDRAAVATPIYEAVGTVAGIVGPPVVGHLADVSDDLRMVLFIAPLAGFTLAAIALAWEICDRRNNVAGTLRVPSAEFTQT